MNDLREAKLLLIEVCSNKFWLECNALSTFLYDFSQKSLQICLCSISRQYFQHEQKKLHQLRNDFSNNQIKFQEILQQHSRQLLTLISNNQQETEDIQRCLHKLEQEWTHAQTDFNAYQNNLTQTMIKLEEFNAKFPNVTTWFDYISSYATSIETDNEIEHCRIFKEQLDNKYIDIVKLKQDHTDIEQQNEYLLVKTSSFVEEKLLEIDFKWTQLDNKIQEQ